MEANEEPTDPEMIAQLRANFAPASRDIKERVASRLAHSVGAAALGGAALGAPAGLSARPAATLLSVLQAHHFGFLVSFLVGAACGAGLYAAAHGPQPERVVYVDRPVTQAAATVPTAQSARRNAESAAPSSQPTLVASAVVPALSASVDRGSTASLAEQQALLDVARAAFARSDYAATLTTLAAHFRRFPKSVLGEEREALEIKALAAIGRDAEAKERASRFKIQFPQSLLLPSVRDSVGAIP